MSGSAHRGDHDVAFYEATIGYTFGGGTGTTAPSYLNSDDDGPLPPARYLIQVIEVGNSDTVCWIGTEPFEKGSTPSAIDGPGPDRIPLKRTTLLAIEMHVLAGENDRIVIQTSVSTAIVYVTQVSTLIPKGA